MAASRHWTPILEDIKLEQTTSTMFSMLPTSLQSRLPPLRSVRKSVSMQTLKTPSATQPPSHGPTRSLSRIDAVPLASSPELVGEDADGQMRLVVGRESPPPDYPSTPLIEEPVEAATPRLPSGVHWRYAQQGLSLMAVAQEEARQPMTRSGPEFERKAFLDGAEYILKALPDDLSEQEIDRLRASTPLNFLPNSSSDPNERIFYPYRRAGQPKSVLHRAVQALVIQVFILIQLALPYIVLLLRLAARTEREYKVSQNVVSVGIGLANTIGSNGMRVTSSFCNMGDGRVGQALGDVVAWTVEGLTGGLTEGVGEGLAIMGAKGHAQ